MISILSQIDKELRSWIAIWRFLRGLDHYGLKFCFSDAEANARHETPASQQAETGQPSIG